MDPFTSSLSRRTFLRDSTHAGLSLAALGLAAPRIFAAGSDTIRLGLIGCGGRGTGALLNSLEADQGVTVAAMADAFQDRVEGSTNQIRKWCQDNKRDFDSLYKVLPERRFVGFDAYRKLLECEDIHAVILATPPVFRPLHFEAAVKAGKHVFMEKPVAVDPPGARRIIEAGELAKIKGLSVVAGTQRRRLKAYRQNQYAVSHGSIGRLLSGRVWWCMGALWHKPRQTGQTDAEYLVRNWTSFTEMSGDHIVEQHVHNLDVANWFIGRPPKMALGFGGRARRKTGNQFDFFSVDFDYGEDVIVHSMCRQVTGCYGRVSEHFVGTEGTVTPDSKVQDKDIQVPDFEDGNPLVLEHRDLIRSIREGKPLNEAQQVAESTLTAIMGRISAYTGQVVRWSDLTETKTSQWYDLRLCPGPEDFETGIVQAPKDDVIPIPGRDEASDVPRGPGQSREKVGGR